MSRLETVEHRQGRLAPLVRRRRVHLMLWIVLIEGILVLFGAVPWWAVLALTVVAFGFYVAGGRGHGHPLVRELSWIAAVSQLVVVLVPVLAVVLTTLAVAALFIVAVGVLVLLVLDRR